MNKQGIMESLTEEQQMEVYNLMSIGNIEDMDTAAQLLVNANFDLNKAVSTLMGMHQEHDTFQQEQHHNEFEEHRMHEEPVSYQKEKENEDLAYLYRKHLEKQAEQGEESWGIDPLKKGVNNLLSGAKNAWNSVVKGELTSGEQFINFLRNQHEKESKNLKFNAGNFEESIQKAAANLKPLLVYVHVDNADNGVIISEFIASPGIANLINTKFYSIGLLNRMENVNALSKYVTVGHNCLFAVFRMNLLDEVQLLETIPLEIHMDVFDLEDHLRSVEGNFYLLMAEEDKIKNDVKRKMAQEKSNAQMEGIDRYYEHQQERRIDNFGQESHVAPDYIIAEQEKLEEERILRQIQEEEYKEVERKIKEQDEMKRIQENYRIAQEEKEKKERAMKEEQKRRDDEDKEKRKQMKLASMPAEPEEGPNVISILFRTPDGNRIERRFKTSDKVQILYDYIDTRDVTFDKNTVRYDLIQPRPFLCLDDKKKTLEEMFEGSNQEIIQIREHTE